MQLKIGFFYKYKYKYIIALLNTLYSFSLYIFSRIHFLNGTYHFLFAFYIIISSILFYSCFGIKTYFTGLGFALFWPAFGFFFDL